ncbi:carboxymuconolactone decarboxylase family protein [Streptomyces fradiae]
MRIALHNGVTKEEIVEAFIQMAVYAGVARAFDSYAVAREVFAEYDEKA